MECRRRQALITAISRRLGHTLPSSLLGEASWAVPRVGAYVRMAATFAARRGMAAHLSKFATHGRTLWRLHRGPSM